jgi:3-oxoadipate enol-lactonase
MLLLCMAILPACRTAPQVWQRALLHGAQLEYRVQGSGEPIVFVHAGVFGEWFEPLLRERALARNFRLITYHRAGYAGSDKLPGAMSIAQQAGQLRLLLRHLGIERSHVVGHSSGALIALQLAIHAPECVKSLSLLEPALPMISAAVPGVPAPRSGIAAAITHYRAGDAVAAVDSFLSAVAGIDYRTALDAALPDAFAHGVMNADTFFREELPAVNAWRLRDEDAARIRQPALAVMGEYSPMVSPIWQQRQDWMMDSLPNVEAFVLPRATHLLHLQNLRGMAERLAAFIDANR